MIPHFSFDMHTARLILDIVLTFLFAGLGWTWGCRIASKIP
jgi:hypothetical protein